MDKAPFISVLLPLRDAAPHLEACLESLAGQTLRGFEVVAVDNGSRDATPAILAAWQGRLPRLKVLRQEGGSLLDALNAGLAACEGRLIARMDGDDLCLPQRFEAQAAFLEAHPKVGLCGTRVALFAEAGLSEGYQAYQAWVNGPVAEEDLLRELFVECPLPHPTWMGRREAFLALGGYQDEGLPEDYHLLLRLVQAGWGLAKLPEALLRWREHPERHSRAHERYRREAFFRLKARFVPRLLRLGRAGAGGPPGRPYTCAVWGAGNRGRLFIRCLQGEGVKVAFCVGVSEPGGAKPTAAHGVAVIPPEDLPRELPGPLLVCVGTPGVRPSIEAFLTGRGLRQGQEWWYAS